MNKYPLYDCSLRLDGNAGSVIRKTGCTAAEIAIYASMHTTQGEPFVENSIRPTLDKNKKQMIRLETPSSLYDWLAKFEFETARTHEGGSFVKSIFASPKDLPMTLDDIRSVLATEEGNQPYIDEASYEGVETDISWQAGLSNGIAQVRAEMPKEKADEIESKRPNRVEVVYGKTTYQITLGERVGLETIDANLVSVVYKVGKKNSRVKADTELKKALGVSGG